MTKKVKTNAGIKDGGGIIAEHKDRTVRHFRRDAERALRVRDKKQPTKPEGFA